MNDKIAEHNEKLQSEKWKEMVWAAADAVEDFNDFIDDRAILWADKRIKELESRCRILLGEK